MFNLAKIIGLEPLQQYSKILSIPEPITVISMLAMLEIPNSLLDEIIVIRNGKVLSSDDLIVESDEIRIFPVVMGG